MRGAFVVLFAVLLIPRASPAWGRLAHEVVGHLAEGQLTPPASAGVRRLLRGGRLSDSSVANWADDLVKHQPASAPWHYVNIPRGSGRYTPERDCPTGDCVVAKIDEYLKKLADRGVPTAERADALRLVVHLVADAQQPLHCIDDRDRGGNEVAVEYQGRSDLTLHQVWDSVLVDEDKGRRSETAFEAHLNRDLSPEFVRRFSGGNLVEWVNQCHADGEIIFDALKLRGGRERVRLRDSYGREQAESLELDLERAGIRLAVLLNQALAREPVDLAPRQSHRRHHRQRS